LGEHARRDRSLSQYLTDLRVWGPPLHVEEPSGEVWIAGILPQRLDTDRHRALALALHQRDQVPAALEIEGLFAVGRDSSRRVRVARERPGDGRFVRRDGLS